MYIKYNFNDTSRRYTFADVKIGQVFEHSYGAYTNVYMRTEPVKGTNRDEYYRAINLKTGYMCRMNDDDNATLIDGEYLVKRMRSFANTDVPEKKNF